ncbi:HNH endonuclease [Gordonia phage Gsput1]|uniref:HNH endonuclease n=1 Tax=Gordonia phage Gsput1 TaxID=1622193 RepID=A0A0E3T8A7_9CAUD|nr:HNH endonuclease [Gordonia phage Gsput1]AKC03065.1 hypothetical protein Gsput1_40 [Gordonia phage Gsput1]
MTSLTSHRESERWLPVPDFDGYEVSDLGRVRSVAREIVMRDGRKRKVPERLLRPGVSGSGHLVVAPSRQSRMVHRLVLEAFVGARPEGMVCRHLNGDPADNRLENLQWGTYSSNSIDAYEHGASWQSKVTHCPSGHPYSGDNLRRYTRKNGRDSRVCRACANQSAKERRR